MKPTLFPAIAYAVAASLFWWGSQVSYGLPGACLLILTFVLIGASGFTALNWIAWAISARARDYTAGRAAAELQLIEARRLFVAQIAGLNPDQLKAIGMFRLDVEVTPDDRGPVYTYRIGELDFTFDELSVFWSACGRAYLAPVGRWGEGSRMRRIAETITAWLVADGCAEKAGGPNPAKWLDRELAAIKLGLKQEEEV